MGSTSGEFTLHGDHLDIELGIDWSRNFGHFWQNTKMHAEVFEQWGQLGPSPHPQLYIAEVRTRWFPNGPGVGGVQKGGYGYVFHVRTKERRNGINFVIKMWW